MPTHATGGDPEPLARVVLEDVPVDREADDAPEREHEIRLGRQGAAGHVVRHEQQEAHDDRHRDADNAGDLGKLVAVFPCELQRRRRC